MNISIGTDDARDMQTWSAGAVAWLCTVLEERYGASLSLNVVEGAWRLSLKGYKNLIRIVANSATFSRADSNLPCAIWNAEREGWAPILGEPLPAPGVALLPSSLIERTEDGYLVRYDVLGLTYWMLTRQEEVARTDLDEHGRFAATSSHAFKHGYLGRPVVDEWLDILGQVIQRTWPSLKLKKNAFSMKVSHDVDSASRYGFRPWRKVPLGIASDVFRNRDARGLLGPWIRLNTRDRLHPLDGFNTFDWLMDASEQRDLQSAFYFICERRGASYDSDYNLDHPAIQHVFREIHRRGHEIGLHPSYNSYLDPERIGREAKRLRSACADLEIDQAIWGGRMHWLQWSHPLTLRAWSDANMAYDSTMAYAECPGFRCGTCFEYPAFDPVTQVTLPIRIRPLIVMEGSVVATYGLGLGIGADARQIMLGLKDVCRRVGGCYTLLWHNSSLLTRGWRDLYVEVLDG